MKPEAARAVTAVAIIGLMAPTCYLGGPGCRRGGEPEGQATVAVRAAAPSPLAQGTSQPAAPAEPLPPMAATHRTAAIPLDPADDGWASEVFAEAAAGQLARLATALGAGGEPDGAAAVAAEDFVAEGQLVPAGTVEAYRDPVVRVHRARGDNRGGAETAADGDEGGPAARGRDGFVAALAEFVREVAAAPDRRVAFKIVRVSLNPGGGAASTEILAELAGATGGGRVQVNATWSAGWELPDDGSPPLLASLAPRDYERVETVGMAPGEPLFSDATTAVLGAEPSFREQVARGVNHWLQRVEMVHGLLFFSRHGLAVADVDGDGLDDVYLCQPAGLPNRLYLQRADGTARDASAAFGLDWLDATSSALFVDLDNDGDQDAALATIEGVQVLENDPSTQPRFTPRASHTPRDRDTHALSAVDYDGDGDLDLYLTVDFANSSTIRRENLPAFVYHDANDGGANVLLRNGGGWDFSAVTASAGLEVRNRRHSLAAAWEDFDDDGDPDLYVANDYGQNCLYRNLGDGRFEEVAGGSGVIDHGGGMSVTWGDYDRDGRVDLYVSNMFSAAGSRITRQGQFMPGSEGVQPIYQRFTKGNSLFRNLGGGAFEEVGPAAGVEMARWAWGSLFTDINNDGWEDLVVANGYLTGFDSGDL